MEALIMDLSDSSSCSGSESDSDERSGSGNIKCASYHYGAERCCKILENLNCDRKNGICCDVVIKIEGRNFSVHKSVLKAQSSYFDIMFTGPFLEKEQEIIKMNEVSKEVFELVLEFLYGQKIRLNIGNLGIVYAAAEMFLIDSLMEECRNYLKKLWKPSKICNGYKFSPKQIVDVVMRVYRLSHRMDMKDLAMTIMPQFKKEASHYNKCEELVLELDLEFLSYFIEIKPVWDVAGTVNSLNFMIKWFYYKPKIRLRDVIHFLDTIEFRLLPIEVFRNFQSNLLKLTKECRFEKEQKLVEFFKRNERKCFNTEKFNATFFHQSYADKVATIGISNETMGDWIIQKFELDEIVLQVVKLKDKLVLFDISLCHVIDLDSWKINAKNFDCQFESPRDFVACSQNERLFVCGDVQFKGRTRLKLFQLKICKEQLGIIELAHFDVPSHWVTSMSSTSEAIYILCLQNKEWGCFCVYRGKESTQHFFNETILPTRFHFSHHYMGVVFFFLNKNHILLFSPFTSKNLIDGIEMILNVQDGDVLLWLKRIEHMDEVANDKDSLGFVEGSVRAVLQNEENLILVQQKEHLLLFSLNGLSDFKAVGFLPVIKNQLINSKSCAFFLD